MAVSSHPDHFFQTSSSLAENERKVRKSSNTFGQPIKFSTKLLAVQISQLFDIDGDVVFVTEAGGTVSLLRLSTNEVTALGKGVGAPLTCLAFHASKINGVPMFHLFAGCWDKTITSQTLRLPVQMTSGRLSTEQNSFRAHMDFVKCLLVARTPDGVFVLISGGADGDVNIWSVDGQRLSYLKPQCRGIEALSLDPLSAPAAPVIFFSTSQREIFTFVLPAMIEMKSKPPVLSEPIIQHETSVYRLVFDNDGDLWTASADKTAKHLVRHNNFTADTVLPHPDFVRDVVVHDQYGLVITACRDEEIRVWNSATSELLHIFTGHYEEITGLELRGDLLISISIDATLRRWSLAPRDLQRAIEEAKNPQLLEQEPEPTVETGMLTAEEEAELQALMAEEEEEVLHKMALDEQ